MHATTITNISPIVLLLTNTFTVHDMPMHQQLNIVLHLAFLFYFFVLKPTNTKHHCEQKSVMLLHTSVVIVS